MNWIEMKWNETKRAFVFIKLNWKLTVFICLLFLWTRRKQKKKKHLRRSNLKRCVVTIRSLFWFFFGAKFTLHKFIHSHQTGKWMGFSWEKCHPTEPFHIRLRALLVFFSHLIFIFFSFGNWLLFWPSYTVTLSSCVLLLLVCSLRLLSFPNDCCLWCTHYDNKWFHIRFRLFCFILFGRLSETSLFESVSYQYHQSSSCCFHSVSLAHALSICEAQSLYFLDVFVSFLLSKKHNKITNDKKKLLTFFGTLRSIFLILCEWGTELCLITFVVVLLHTQLLCALRVCREALYYHNHHEMTVFNNNKKNLLIRWERA